MLAAVNGLILLSIGIYKLCRYLDDTYSFKLVTSIMVILNMTVILCLTYLLGVFYVYRVLFG